jgi:recombination protein RecA
MFGNPETTTGGRALKFYSSIRMEIRRIAGIKGAENAEIGNRVKVKIVKNKMAPPFRSAEFDILFNEGISRTGSIIDLGVDFGIIEKKGSWFSYNGEKLEQGREAVREKLKADPSMTDELERLIMEKMSSKKFIEAHASEEASLEASF